MRLLLKPVYTSAIRFNSQSQTPSFGSLITNAKNLFKVYGRPAIIFHYTQSFLVIGGTYMLLTDDILYRVTGIVDKWTFIPAERRKQLQNPNFSRFATAVLIYKLIFPVRCFITYLAVRGYVKYTKGV